MSPASDALAAPGTRGVLAPRLRAGVTGAVLLAIPVLLAALFLSHFAGIAIQRTYTIFLINLIAVLGIGAFSGNSGILSFGHVAFIGLGAYVSGLLTIPVATKASVLPALPAFLATTQMSLLPAE